MRSRHALAAFALASVLLAAGCGEGSMDGAGQSPERPTTSPSPSRSATLSPAPTDASPREVESSSSGAEAGDSAVKLSSVQVTEHDAYDRVRFEFSGGPTKVFAEYMEALREPGRGKRIPLAGEHQLVLVFVGLERQTPTVETKSTTAVREVHAAGVFEGEMIVGIGTDTEGEGPAGFRVRLDGDDVIVDVAHKAAPTSP